MARVSLAQSSCEISVEDFPDFMEVIRMVNLRI